MTIEEKLSKLSEWMEVCFIPYLKLKHDPIIRDMMPIQPHESNAILTHALRFNTPRAHLNLDENHGWGKLIGRDKQIGLLQFRHWDNATLMPFDKYVLK